MLMLLFYVGDDLYALDSSQVVEVIPRVALRKVPHAPSYITGTFNYRGAIVPIVDLCSLIQGSPSRSHLSTRIIMVNYRGNDNQDHCLGLMAERVTETLNKPHTEFVNSTLTVNNAPYLGEMILDEKGMIQRIRLEYLLPDSQQGYLLPAQT